MIGRKCHIYVIAIDITRISINRKVECVSWRYSVSLQVSLLSLRQNGEAMIENLKQAFFPLLLTGSIFGIIILEYPMYKIIIYINIMYILCWWISYFIFFKYLLSSSIFNILFENNASILVLYFNMTTTITSMFFCLFNSKVRYLI